MEFLQVLARPPNPWAPRWAPPCAAARWSFCYWAPPALSPGCAPAPSRRVNPWVKPWVNHGKTLFWEWSTSFFNTGVGIDVPWDFERHLQITVGDCIPNSRLMFNCDMYQPLIHHLSFLCAKPYGRWWKKWMIRGCLDDEKWMILVGKPRPCLPAMTGNARHTTYLYHFFWFFMGKSEEQW